MQQLFLLKKTNSELLITSHKVLIISWIRWVHLVLCNRVLQYLLFAKLAEEFAQPSITPPHIRDVIMRIPRLCM